LGHPSLALTSCSRWILPRLMFTRHPEDVLRAEAARVRRGPWEQVQLFQVSDMREPSHVGFGMQFPQKSRSHPHQCHRRERRSPRTTRKESTLTTYRRMDPSFDLSPNVSREHGIRQTLQYFSLHCCFLALGQYQSGGQKARDPNN
jgi:hypothetical protein